MTVRGAFLPFPGNSWEGNFQLGTKRSKDRKQRSAMREAGRYPGKYDASIGALARQFGAGSLLSGWGPSPM